MTRNARWVARGKTPALNPWIPNGRFWVRLALSITASRESWTSSRKTISAGLFLSRFFLGWAIFGLASPMLMPRLSGAAMTCNFICIPSIISIAWLKKVASHRINFRPPRT
ncbi:MAG: hypothetical protein DMG33_13790 [Acidobacteria bacterium]|nr:MAG: hypothetical protein DMG33_13790 [Acidobacteriota bacterium]